MRLGIISDCIHIRDNTGRIGSLNHVYVMQMNAMAGYFAETVFCTPVIDAGPDTPPLSYYTQSGIQFLPLPEAGGKSWRNKLHLLTMIPRWFKAFILLGKQVDLIYQRFPNNLNIPGFFYVLFNRKAAFATYTGTWLGYPGESLTYRLQRWLLKNLYPGPVFVYDFTIKHSRIFPTISPSYNQVDWNAESAMVSDKVARIQQRNVNESITIVSVGSLINYKNHRLLIEACILLKKANRPFILYLAGDGVLKDELMALVKKEELTDCIHFLGIIPQSELRKYYRKADFVIQPSIIEGYGKVPVEGMFHAAVPLLSPVSIHPYFVGNNNERGALFNLDNPEQIISAINYFVQDTAAWCNAISAGRTFSYEFTTEAWMTSIVNVLTQKGFYS